MGRMGSSGAPGASGPSRRKTATTWLYSAIACAVFVGLLEKITPKKTQNSRHA